MSPAPAAHPPKWSRVTAPMTGTFGILYRCASPMSRCDAAAIWKSRAVAAVSNLVTKPLFGSTGK